MSATRKRDAVNMATRQRKLVESIAEFISRFWPVSKSEETILEEQAAMHRSHTREDDFSADDRT